MRDRERELRSTPYGSRTELDPFSHVIRAEVRRGLGEASKRVIQAPEMRIEPGVLLPRTGLPEAQAAPRQPGLQTEEAGVGPQPQGPSAALLAAAVAPLLLAGHGFGLEGGFALLAVQLPGPPVLEPDL